jgi:hypothetical protein
MPARQGSLAAVVKDKERLVVVLEAETAGRQSRQQQLGEAKKERGSLRSQAEALQVGRLAGGACGESCGARQGWPGRRLLGASHLAGGKCNAWQLQMWLCPEVLF